MPSICSIRLTVNEPDEDEDNFNNGNSGLKTLNLRLDEVAHIRSALTKAELEGILDGNLRNDIERGTVRLTLGKTISAFLSVTVFRKYKFLHFKAENSQV